MESELSRLLFLVQNENPVYRLQSLYLAGAIQIEFCAHVWLGHVLLHPSPCHGALSVHGGQTGVRSGSIESWDIQLGKRFF